MHRRPIIIYYYSMRDITNYRLGEPTCNGIMILFLYGIVIISDYFIARS